MNGGETNFHIFIIIFILTHNPVGGGGICQQSALLFIYLTLHRFNVV
jgi:hypothetical protein